MAEKGAANFAAPRGILFWVGCMLSVVVINGGRGEIGIIRNRNCIPFRLCAGVVNFGKACAIFERPIKYFLPIFIS